MAARNPIVIDAVPERVSREPSSAHSQSSPNAQSQHTSNTAAPTRKRPTWKRVVIGVLAVLYVLSPLDLLPDWIPLIGWLDDIGVLAWAARQVFFKK